MLDFSNKKVYYNIYKKRKPSGKMQTIFEVLEPLKSEQIKFKNKLEDVAVISDHLYGFVKNKTTKHLAEKHINKKWVITLDIKDFFPSIKKRLLLENLGFTEYESELCTYNNSLVFGSPCSPIISNLIMSPIIENLNLYFKNIDDSIYLGAYADDISISGNNIKPSWQMIKYIESELNKYGLKVNNKKTKFMFNNSRQEVLGLTVNTKVSFNKKHRSQLKFRAKRDMLTVNDIGVLSYLNSVSKEQYLKIK